MNSRKPTTLWGVIRLPDLTELYVNAMKSVYNQVKAPVLHVFNDSIQFGIFPEKMKISKGYSNI